MNSCEVCGNAMQTGWVACPFCGVHIDNVFNSSMPLVEIAETRCQTGCSGNCSSGKKKSKKPKKIRSKCCKKHERKKKPCKSCPELHDSVQGVSTNFVSIEPIPGASFAANACRR